METLLVEARTPNEALSEVIKQLPALTTDGLTITIGAPLSSVGITAVEKERYRQIVDEGWTSDHDDDVHIDDELVRAAIAYAASAANLTVKAAYGKARLVDPWPWTQEYDKRKKHSPLKKLVIAGALIVAEIERRIRNHEV